MKRNLLKGAGLAAAVVFLCSTYFAGLHAQQPATNPASGPARTNWIGYLVVGQNDTSDRIAIGGPHPVVAGQLQVGLRSDGVVVWRQATNAK